MDKLLSIFLLTLLITTVVQAQNPKLEQLISKADESYDSGDYYTALTYYELALEYKDNQPLVAQRLAETALYFKTYPRAEKAYRNIIRYQPKVKSAKFWLGHVLQHQGNYDEAKIWYDKYLETNDTENQNLIDDAYKGIEDCNFAAAAIAEPKEAVVLHLDTTVNTPDAEFNPFPFGDTLYYSTLQNVFEDDDHFPPRKYSKLYYQLGTEDGLKLPDYINEEGKHVSNIAFNERRDRMFFTLCEYTDTAAIRCDIYTAEMLGPGRWGKKIPLNINVAGKTTTQPTIGFDEGSQLEMIYFISDRDGGQGGMDIWAASINADGICGNPFNVEALNTARDEQTPYFHTSSQRLYFSSKGYESFGGFDIYNAQLEQGEWSQVFNLGTPVNSSYDDLYYLRSDCSKSYFASNRWAEGIKLITEPGKETCCYDIYSVDIVPNIDLDLTVFDCDNQIDLVGVKVQVFRDLGDGKRQLKDTVLDPTGSTFKLRLNRCEKYIIEASKPHYESYVFNLDLTENSKEFKKNIPTEFDYPIEVEKEICLKPIQVELVIKPCDADDQNNAMVGVRATFSLLDQANGTKQVIGVEENSLEPEILFPAIVGKTYELKLEKPGYESRIDTVEVSQQRYEIYGRRITIEACLDRINPPQFLPMSLYFDNAIPGPHPQTFTDKIYDDLYQIYYDRKDVFYENFTKDGSESGQFGLRSSFEYFFDREVKEQGHDRFIKFCDALLEYLESGSTFSMSITGFASPRGAAEYNLKLSMRRVDSVENFLEQYKNGAFLPYIRSGKLYIERQYRGETTAAGEISADLEDEKNSIFAVAASVERRVEINQLKGNSDNDNTRD